MAEDRGDEVWRRSPDLGVVEGPGRVVVLDLSRPRTARPFVMQGSAEAVWRALSRPRSTQQVVTYVADDFGIPATEVEADVVSFLLQLQARGLVRTGFRRSP